MFLEMLSYSHWPRQCPRKPQAYSHFKWCAPWTFPCLHSMMIQYSKFESWIMMLIIQRYSYSRSTISDVHQPECSHSSPTLISYTFPSGILAATEPLNNLQYSNPQINSTPFWYALANEQALSIGESYGERQQVKPVPCTTDKRLTQKHNLFVK